MLNLQLRSFIRKNRYLFVLIILIAGMLLQPLTLGFPFINTLIELGLLLTIAFGPYLITRYRSLLIVPIVYLALLFLVGELPIQNIGVVNEDASRAATFSTLILEGLIVGFLLYHVLHEPIPAGELIYSTILIFFFIGLAFADTYHTIYVFSGGDGFVIGDGIAADGVTLNDFLYFSFATQTTLGYGDMSPGSVIPDGNPAVPFFTQRMVIIQSIIGVMYMAIFVGRIVGVVSSDPAFQITKSPDTGLFGAEEESKESVVEQAED